MVMMAIDFMMMFSCLLNAIPRAGSGATDIKGPAALVSSGYAVRPLGCQCLFPLAKGVKKDDDGLNSLLNILRTPRPDSNITNARLVVPTRLQDVHWCVRVWWRDDSANYRSTT